MPFNGSGTFNRIYSWVTDAANGIKIRADRMDTDTNDIAAGLSLCLTRDGQSVALADLPMGGFNFTGVGDATTDDEFSSYGQLKDLGRDQSGNYALATASGNNYTVVYDPPITVHTIGVPLRFKVPSSNVTGAVTLNPGPGVKALLRGNNPQFFQGDLSSSIIYTAIYNGVSYVVEEFVSVDLVGAGYTSAVNVPNDGSFHTILDMSTVTGQGRMLTMVNSLYAPLSQSWDGLVLAVQFASGTGAGNTPATNVSIQNAPGTMVFQVVGNLLQMSITGGGGVCSVTCKVVSIF